jgi:methylenetetrahydrofolate reductase (NADPH)
MSSHLPLSFEFFPPKTPEGMEKLSLTRQALSVLQPDFFSVTYGAGGSTQDGSLAAVQSILDAGQVAVPHFTCVGATQDSVRAQLAVYQKMGITRILALRGDLPSGYGAAGAFRYASDLIAFIRAETGDHFAIEVAAYPDTHPQARSPAADIDALAAKVDAGAQSALTQYFFNPDAYARLLDETAKRAIHIPIVPGIMPITNSTQLLRFSDACGAEVPRWIRQRLTAFGDDKASIQAFGHEVVVNLCERLRSLGIPGFHFYPLNTSAPTLALCRDLGLSAP